MIAFIYYVNDLNKLQQMKAGVQKSHDFPFLEREIHYGSWFSHSWNFDNYNVCYKRVYLNTVKLRTYQWRKG